MDSTSSSKISTATSFRRPSNRLLYDRRYGWVFDEWKEPSEEALAGGRGMFCILPLAKAFLNTATNSINLAANFAVKVFERPDLFSPQALQANLDEQLKKFSSSLKTPEINIFALNVKNSSKTSTFPSHLQVGTTESDMT
ncbi:hypothetical protein P3X46_028181 [Hevea brasiliensis]|uniref:Uncharacterized protein n=1 Tax=Hevea brasiliensis TaxID=3981 RepID=A0ABQ9KQ61_HEVBR|nr:uncharacterized protein LOC110669428 [Hevea brasiliensis]XP_057994254.1 uncharacterized protein LOC110669428 [Hevea brasiliensis]KAJ9145849.1 hypothetical protein P3X46_028181 [Hevea brasiliensis]